MRESYLLSRIVSLLKRLKKAGEPIFWFKTKGDPVGIPDLIICHKGKFIAVELKTPVGRVSAAQKFVMSEIEKAGGKCYVVRSVNELEAILKGSPNVIQSAVKHRCNSKAT